MRIARTIARIDDPGVHQLVMYDRGIGTGGAADRLLGDAFGDGIDQNIEELYTFLALNYVAGDEIYMFVFSRGAYTVRSLAGMIDSVGLVRRDSLDQIKNAYELYRADVPATRTLPQNVSRSDHFTETVYRSNAWYVSTRWGH